MRLNAPSRAEYESPFAPRGLAHYSKASIEEPTRAIELIIRPNQIATSF
jgi:hypothetical protein